MTEQERQRAIHTAEAMWGGFYRCPTSGRIIEALPGDDKAMCPCGRSNPNVPTERTERTGVHVVRFLKSATAAEYVDQQQRDLAARAAQEA
jgi:hypothetical protein